MLIGDLIIGARELYPDLPQVLPPPILTSLVPIQVSGGAVFPGTYFCKLTQLTPWGESLPSSEQTVIVANPNNAIQVNWSSQLANPTGINLYLGISAPGSEQVWVNPGTLFTPFNIVSIPLINGTPPNRSTAFLPDTNGRMVSVGTLYRWINEGLTVASYICKGIPDISGIQLVSGQGMYIMPGVWDKFENCWYDGFPVAFDARSGAFYRNVLSGITFIAILQTNADRQVMEFQPQPSRSGGTTTLSAPISITDTVIPLTSVAQIGLPLGMAQIGTEIITYSSLSGGSLFGCVRGLGGTQPQAWVAGTVVRELNFRFGGLRLGQPTQYSPGQALVNLQLPPGWGPALVDYLVGRFREAEQNSQGKGESIKAFSSFLKDYVKGTKQVAGPRQVGGAGTGAGDGYPSASSGGRLIIP